MKVTSSAFEEGQAIPKQFTCEGEDKNPALLIADVPDAAQEIALIVDDPDAPGGVFTHWIVLNIAPQSEIAIPEHSVPVGSVQGVNSAGHNSYMGPCPPTGTHHYRFTAYALREPLALADAANRDRVEATLHTDNMILEQATLTGVYEKERATSEQSVG